MSKTPVTKEALKQRKRELELTKLELEVRQATADAEKAEHETIIQRYIREDEDRTDKKRKAVEVLNGVYTFSTQVDAGSVHTFSSWLRQRCQTDPGKEVTLRIFSPGGSVFAGFVMMDAMREAQENHDVKITAKITGYGASMAGFIAQAAHTRLIGRDSYLMLHEISQGMLGSYKQSELEDEVDFTRRLSRRAMEYYADRSNGKWTVDSLEKKIRKLDWWLNADEALDNGFVDGLF